MIVRVARDGDLLLDLESVFAHGQRYALSAEPERIESRGRPPRLWRRGGSVCERRAAVPAPSSAQSLAAAKARPSEPPPAQRPDWAWPTGEIYECRQVRS